MKTRIITSILIVAIAIPTFILSGTPVYPVVLALLSLRSVYEMLRVLRFDKKIGVAIPSYLMALVLPITAYFYRSEVKDFFVFCSICIYFYLLYLLMAAIVTRASIRFSSIARVFCAASYVILAFAALAIIRYIENGEFVFVLPYICSWASDVFALIVGSLIGKHKLIPEISPKKTVEGAIGGIVGATLLMLLFGFIVSVTTNLTPNYLVLALLGFVLSAISQVGDLIASLIKREHGVKDYGNIFPGHGGVMDRFDSVLSITTILMVVCILFPPFT